MKIFLHHSISIFFEFSSTFALGIRLIKTYEWERQIVRKKGSIHVSVYSRVKMITFVCNHAKLSYSNSNNPITTHRRSQGISMITQCDDTRTHGSNG